jgi:hypothetical protein
MTFMIDPFLASFITFGGLLSQMREQTTGLAMLVFAFQNGFVPIGKPAP